MFLVKLGGSVITVKSRYRVFREKAVSEMLQQLKATGEPFALVHGGGSFGHIKAKEFGLPGNLSEKTIQGCSIVHRDMIDLDQRIIKSMNNIGLAGLGISPALFSNKVDELVEVFSMYSKNGFSPVTFGDVYIDEEKNRVEIISGDDLILELTRKLKPTRVIFLTDVDGIFDRNPKKFPGAKLLKVLNESPRYDTHGTDVTGGMEKKAGIIKEIARTGTTVYVLNGNKPSRIHDIQTERFIGTVIR